MRSLLRSLSLIAVAAAAMLALVAGSLLAPTPSLAQDAGERADESAAEAESDTEQRVRVLLSGYDYFPTREDLDAVGADIPATLIAIYNDPGARPTLKGRCIDALGYYNDETTRQFLEVLIANEGSAEVASSHVHKALTAYSKAFGDQSLTVVAPFLEHDDVQLRITASVAIAKSGGRPGRKILENRLQTEPSEVARERIQQALEQNPR